MNQLFLALLAALVLIIGCASLGGTNVESPSDECVSICMQQKETADYSTGPCLANPLPKNPDYVCDIAHFPRSPMDDIPKNQCSEFLQGNAHHYIEANPDCHIIGVY